jgi:hypothetical protein
VDKYHGGVWVEEEINHRVRHIADETWTGEDIFVASCRERHERNCGGCEYDSFNDPFSRKKPEGRKKAVPSGPR